ncbi:unnamed protein product [Effrenium voratum]|nr:unnamed protein product [Effrenium voratum]|mmetsp:Transcript_62635/g.149439  ORF Transcript_62635/g.149439 Transcript_62635/m.149439 type:complete len:120 (-) Transcript_62635:146-505(-)
MASPAPEWVLRGLGFCISLLLMVYGVVAALLIQRLLALRLARPEEDGEPCSICLCPLNHGRQDLPCNHAFHEECLTQWWLAAGKPYLSCPHCRRQYLVDTSAAHDCPQQQQCEDVEMQP